jgi:hypothetical protein
MIVKNNKYQKEWHNATKLLSFWGINKNRFLSINASASKFKKVHYFATIL